MTGPSDEAKFVDRTQDDSSRVCYDERLAPGAPWRTALPDGT
jgi:hypothetical protein